MKTSYLSTALLVLFALTSLAVASQNAAPISAEVSINAAEVESSFICP